MSQDKLYTLVEARLELNREECRLRGHDYNIVERTGLDGPAQVLCQRCGKAWGIAEIAKGVA